MITTIIDRLTETNPQIMREWQGRLTPKNISIASIISLVGQLLVYLYYQNLLPVAGVEVYNRYCTVNLPDDYYREISNCIQDLNGQWMIISQLWWLDIFTFLSITGIFALLVVGTYQLIADLSGEERRGTLNFIRLSPQPAKTIFIGKLFGVPILLYLVCLLALPFHLGAGLLAGIPLSLILAFYAVLIASCAFFYHAALSFALATPWLGGFQPWLGSATVLFFVFCSTMITLESGRPSPFDWLILFNPSFVLPYLVKSTFLPPDAVDYPGISHIFDLRWYGQSLWQSVITGISLILLNFALCTYGLTRILQRRFHNPLATLVSKPQSYWMMGCFSTISLGFVFQTLEPSYLFDNFVILSVFVAIFGLLILFALTPPRQTLQDWARYRHLQGKKGISLGKALIFGEKSPSTLAMAVNAAIAILFILPAIFIAPLDGYKLATAAGFLLAMNMILVYAAIAQLLMLARTNKRALLAATSIGILIIFPRLCFVVLRVDPSQSPLLWFFTFLPIAATKYATLPSFALAIFSQWLGLTLLGWQINRQLNRLGASTTKALIPG
ncbi:MAG: hypothetical protein O9276_11940 [Microcystis sp. LE17-20A]|jgi:hypothetical protein|uniref:hypothetical protein n=1 Tax=unclassified Microcystis TaxID=2643300 RepID=UPI0022BDB8CC|nr:MULTISPECIES: hypothetical protein [unclassified Microcystis]MCZ8038812.1 hypothetical protein [Microcystis sp. LE17-20A]MCZ8210454.1 hypothetical protein [Microcystis sp. LE19-8.1F]